MALLLCIAQASSGRRHGGAAATAHLLVFSMRASVGRCCNPRRTDGSSAVESVSVVMSMRAAG